MVGAAMPKTTAHLDRYSGGPEHDIDSASYSRYRSGTHPVAEAESVKLAAKLHLRRSVAAPVGLHGPTCRRTRCPRCLAHGITLSPSGTRHSSHPVHPPRGQVVPPIDGHDAPSGW